jgi:plastocyanin
VLHSALMVFATEKSKVPFYIVGGALAGWAVLLGVIGLTQPDFPGNLGGQRVVMGISVLLVAGTIASSIAVETREVSAKELSTSTSSGAAASPAAPAASSSAAAPAASSSAPAAGAAAGPVDVAADPTGLLKFDKTAITVKAGNDTFNFANASPLPHNFTIQQNGKTLAATPTFSGGSKSFSVALKPGTYTFLCTVPGHAAAGMTGTLTVT